MIMIGKCSGSNSSELGMVLVLPLIGWSVCDLTPWACSFHKMSDTRDDPCSLLAQHPWLCLQLKGQHRQTKRGEEQTFKLVSIRSLIIFCFALLCFFHIAQWLFLVSCCWFFFPRTALFFSIWFHIVGQLQSTRKRNNCEQQHLEERVLNPLHLRSFEVQCFVWRPFLHMDRDSEPTTKQTGQEKGVASQREDVHCAIESSGPENEV